MRTATMTTLLTTIKIAGAAGAIAVGSTILGASDAIGPETHIPMSVAISLVSMGVVAAFTISRRVTQWEDRLDAFQKRLDSLRCMECDPEAQDKADRGDKNGTKHFRHRDK